MCQCSQFDTTTGRCRSGWMAVFPICRGMQRKSEGMPERLTPYCMREEPPAHFIRQDGLPIGWPAHRQATGGE